VLGRSGLGFLALTAVPWMILAGLVFALQASVRDQLLWHETPFRDFWRLPHLGLFFVLPLAAILFWRKDRYLSEFQLALVLSLLSWFYLLNRALAPGQGSLLLLASSVIYSFVGLILLYAVYRLYWRKVYIDELTGLSNRRALDERLADLDGDYALAMADIDFFKKFNDSFGHEEGDNVLRFVAAHLDEATGSRAYRYGGEEFCVVCEKMRESDVLALLEQARSSLAARLFSIRAPSDVRAKTTKVDRRAAHALSVQKVQITMSFGVAQSSRETPAPHDVMKSADELLYKAKEAGRNCVVAGWKR
jgi:diguanylate cyclase (GGDEF)-like protein